MLLLILGVISITALEAGQRTYEDNTRTLFLDTFSDGTGDSVVADSYAITSTKGYYNRITARIIFNDIVDTNGINADFGKTDSIFALLYAVYADEWIIIDVESTTYAAGAAGAAGTLIVKTDFNGDTLFSEKLYLKVRFADTASTQDSVFTIPYTYQIIHTFQ